MTIPAETYRRTGQVGRQARGDYRHGRNRHSGSSPSRQVCQASLCVPAHAFERGRAPQPAHRSRMGKVAEARLAEGAAGEFPSWRARGLRPGRAGSYLRHLDRDQPQLRRRARGRGWPSSRSSNSWRGGSGGLQAMERLRRRVDAVVKDKKTAEALEALLPLPMQTALLQR